MKKMEESALHHSGTAFVGIAVDVVLVGLKHQMHVFVRQEMRVARLKALRVFLAERLQSKLL